MSGRLEEAQARCEAATLGPWCWRRNGFDITLELTPVDRVVTGDEDKVPVLAMPAGTSGGHRPYDNDREFIANARQDLPDALAVVAAVLSLPECPICQQSDLAANPGCWSHKTDCPLAKWAEEDK